MLGIGGLAIRALIGAKDVPSRLNSGQEGQRRDSESLGQIIQDVVSKKVVGTKYIPRVSEEKFQQFLKGRETSDITDDQVYEIMGEPTRREPPITARRNGMVITIYKAFWEVPGSGITSQIGFANGRIAAMIIGLEITPPESDKGR
ncbi:MAG TPA: hypothetical protein VGZ25_02735 [Gemmataceae bacterium]|nr:hypothetical protein [Gemmataceae bacterium]